MANWDPQPPSDAPYESVYSFAFTYDLDPDHQGTIQFSIEGINSPDNDVAESLVAAITASPGWVLSTGFRSWKVGQRLDDSL